MTVSFTYEEALLYKSLINKIAENLDDIEAAKAPLLFEQWAVNKEYTVDNRVCYNNVLYKVLQAHTSQATWTPETATSLYTKILIPDPTIIPDWEQPSSTNPYMTGDKVRHNEKIWISIIDNNVWEPGIYGWEEVIE